MIADQLERLKAALAGRYEIERVLGSGGMATVYLADDLKHRRQLVGARVSAGSVAGFSEGTWLFP